MDYHTFLPPCGKRDHSNRLCMSVCLRQQWIPETVQNYIKSVSFPWVPHMSQLLQENHSGKRKKFWDETNHCRTLTKSSSWFLSKVPSFLFSVPVSLSRKGLLWVPPWCELMPMVGYICTSLSAVHVAVTPSLQLRPGVGNFKLIKIALVHPFWNRKCLTACFTYHVEQTHSAKADEGNECFVYDRFLLLFPRFRSKLLEKFRQNM